MAVDFEPFSTRWREDPYPVYRRLRDRAPVHFAPGARMYCVSRHEDVSFVLRQTALFSSAAMSEVLRPDLGPLRPRTVLALLRFMLRARINPFEAQRRGSLISTDPPRHEEMRRIVSRGFTPRRIAALEPRIRRLVGALTARLARGVPFDVVRDLAVPLPMTVIAEMLGVDSSRHGEFKRWSLALLALISGSARENPLDGGHLEDLGELYAYLRREIRARRAAPREDLVSVLVDPGRGGALDAVDVTQFVVLLLVAGNETTTNLIGNAVSALLDHPEALARVARDPGLVSGAVEEALRFDSPVQIVFRTTTAPAEVAGTTIPAGAVVAALLGSANRDERVFGDPDRFEPERDARAHLAFGFGEHYCLGAALARLEARVALTALAPELPRCKRVGGRAAFSDSFVVRGRTALALQREPGR